MNADVIVTKTETCWRFEPVTAKANAQLHGETFKADTVEEAQKTLFWCTSIGLTVEAPVFTAYYQPPRLGKVKKTFRSKRHPVIGRPL